MYSSRALSPVRQEDATSVDFVVDHITRNTGSVQAQTLAGILYQIDGAEYLRRFDLEGATDIDTFKAKVPVIEYGDISPEIQRFANGDRSRILSSTPISEFLTSSGTAGERKLIPTTHEDMARRGWFYSLQMSIMNK